MNKKIIAIAIATAMAAPVAMADIKVSGRVGAALTSSDKNTGAGSDATKSSREAGDQGLSKITFDGTQGNAFARVGMDIRSIMGGKNAGATINGRDFYLGYKFGAMNVSYGRMPAAAAGLEGDKYNATFLQLRRTAGVATTSNTINDSFTNSPVLMVAGKAGSVKYKVQYDPTDNTAMSTGEGHVAVSVKGKAGPVGLFASYNNGIGTEGTPKNKDTNTKFGASMKFGSVKGTLVSYSADNDGVKDTAAAILADMSLGKGLSVGVGHGSNKAKNTWSRLAISKSINKGTKLFGGLTSKKTNGGTTGQVIGLGMAVKF